MLARLPTEPDPVKLIAALLWHDRFAVDEACRRLTGLWGRIDHTGSDHPFGSSAYYETEMGHGLQKRVISFEALVDSARLAEIKIQAIALEDSLRSSAGRRVNIDPGYLDVHKIVLASVKPSRQKIHLGRGVHADMVLNYSRGKFHPFDWTFADYREGHFHSDFLAIRSIYKAQLTAIFRDGSGGHGHSQPLEG